MANSLVPTPIVGPPVDGGRPGRAARRRLPVRDLRREPAGDASARCAALPHRLSGCAGCSRRQAPEDVRGRRRSRGSIPTIRTSTFRISSSCPPPRWRATGRGFAPRDLLLAVEVVSPSNPGNDLVLKRHAYAVAGIPEYWIVDRRDRTLRVLRLGRAGQVRRRHRGRGGGAVALRHPVPAGDRPGRGLLAVPVLLGGADQLVLQLAGVPAGDRQLACRRPPRRSRSWPAAARRSAAAAPGTTGGCGRSRRRPSARRASPAAPAPGASRRRCAAGRSRPAPRPSAPPSGAASGWCRPARPGSSGPPRRAAAAGRVGRHHAGAEHPAQRLGEPLGLHRLADVVGDAEVEGVDGARRRTR